MPAAVPMIALHHLAAIVGVAALVAAPAVVLMVPVMVLLQIQQTFTERLMAAAYV